MLKIQDNFSDGNSAHDQFWNEASIQKMYKRFRTDAPLWHGIYRSGQFVEKICEIHGLKGVQFGNWLTAEDRYNYLLATHACLFDMNQVLKFKQNSLGLNKSLAVTFGSRGVPNALAHYEGDRLIINLSRYKRSDRLPPELELTKEERFIMTGGVGSFGHEYGHFLDNAFGLHSDQYPGSNWLTTLPRSTSKEKFKYDKKKNPLRWYVEEIFEVMLWTKGKESTFHKRIIKETEYYNRRTEMFARLFEVYLHLKLSDKGIKNTFLIKSKYNRPVYLNKVEMKPIMPLMDKLIAEMRKRS